MNSSVKRLSFLAYICRKVEIYNGVSAQLSLLIFKVVANENALLWNVVAETNVSRFARVHNICSRHKFETKNVSDCFQKILCPQQMFPLLPAQENIMSCATMRPRLPRQCIYRSFKNLFLFCNSINR